MRRYFSSLLFVTIVLLVVVAPFLAFGPQLESAVSQWLLERPDPWIMAGTVVGLLAVDIFLPIPSSVVGTVAGAELGVAGGIAATWLGLTLGAMIGYEMARAWGRPVARRFSSEEDLQQMELLTARHGPLILVLLRAVPVMAEAAVLLAGVHQLSRRRFLVPVMLANAGIAAAYAVFGSFAAEHGWLAVALAIIAAAPLVLIAFVRRWLPR